MDNPKTKGGRKGLAQRDRWKRKLRLSYFRLVRLKGQPEELAWGMAIGIFWGMTPTVPLHMVFAVLNAYLLGKSKLAAGLGVWVVNPFILPFVYLLDYRVGRFLTGTQLPPYTGAELSFTHILEMGWEITLAMLIGGFVTGILTAIPAYFVTKRLVIMYRNSRKRRLGQIGFSSPTT